jgi:hypothetical protein
MNAASRLILDVARQDLADKLARADRRAQRREAANGHRADSGQAAHRHLAWLRLSSRQA